MSRHEVDCRGLGKRRTALSRSDTHAVDTEIIGHKNIAGVNGRTAKALAIGRLVHTKRLDICHRTCAARHTIGRAGGLDGDVPAVHMLKRQEPGVGTNRQTRRGPCRHDNIVAGRVRQLDRTVGPQNRCNARHVAVDISNQLLDTSRCSDPIAVDGNCGSREGGRGRRRTLISVVGRGLDAVLTHIGIDGSSEARSGSRPHVTG